jgi:ATP-dependent helicase/nuclease subunit B
MSDKLSDIALIAEAYDALLQKHLTDPRDKLTKLAAKIGESSIGRTGHIYLDGFTDFTNQERLILDELLKKNADLTVALCLDEDGSDIFQIPFQTMSASSPWRRSEM